MNESKENEILQELQRISKLLALMVTREMIQSERIEFFSNIGFRPKEIADLIGTKSNIVRAVYIPSADMAVLST